MAQRNASQKLTLATSKITSVADLLLNEEGHDWEIDEIHLKPKDERVRDKVVCRWVLENGKKVLKCTKQ